MRKGRRPGKDSLKFEEKSKSVAGGFLFLLLPYEKSSASRICMRVAELIISQRKLFEFDRCASFFEFSFESFSVSFCNAFFNGFRSAINEGFSVFQAEAGYFADNFDYADFLVTSRGEDYVEFGFFFSRSSASSRSSSNSNRSSSRYAEFVFHSFYEFGKFENGHAFNGFHDFFFSHFKIPP